MSTTIKQSQPNTGRRIWHTPTSKAARAWFLFALIYCAAFYILYAVLFKAPIFTGPWFDHVFRAGVMSYLMIVGVAAYSLRTRFMQGLPWKAQNWVWMHVWLGVAAVLLALLHADFRFVLHGYCSNLSCVTAHYWGMPSLYALIFIALSGVFGKLLDKWQAHIIAQDVIVNGIAKAIKGHLQDLQYVIERLSAGKSEAFKQYYVEAIKSSSQLPHNVPIIAQEEQNDFQQAYQTLQDYARLTRSLRKQERARSVFRAWRYIHMALVPLALIIITYHGIAELLINVLHLVKA